MNYEMNPELLDDETHRMEQETPSPHPALTYQKIRPVLTEERYKKLHKCYLLPEHGPLDIQPNTLYFTREPDKKGVLRVHYKFLLLKNKLAQSYKSALDALENADWKAASRKAATGQPNPKKITFGWYPQTPGHIAGHGFDSVRSEPTLNQPGLAHGLRPMVRAMDRLLAEYLPTYYPTALRLAMDALRREDENEVKYLDRVRNSPRSPFPEKDVAALKGMDMLGWLPEMAAYMLWGTVFSTLELNRHIVFRAHEDEYNADGTLVCLSALGDWIGGRIVLPRYGFGADLEPYDLLIVDNRDELHGNLGPLVGDEKSPRFSVVAFLHSNVLEYANREGQWRTRLSSTVGPSPRQPRVWECRKGKNYPGDAVYVGCRVSRGGKVIREGHIFGNGSDPKVSHKGALNSESEFRSYAIEKLRDPAFRAEAEKLRGRDLLCWCVQEGARREEFCHARVWLELINNLQGEPTTTELSTEQRRDFDWGYYEPNFLSKEEADALFEVAKAQPRERTKIRGKLRRRCGSTCWSVRDRHADNYDLMVPLAEAPPEMISLQRKLSDLAGKDINYFSLQAYENERDHIGWHQHREDKCRDARVFIISLGERRSFGVDKLCPECLLCDACNLRRCRPKGPPCANKSKCEAAKEHQNTCAVRKSTKTILLPKHGSLIALTSEANDWYEHAVLDDKEPKGLRISINTKCIPPEDAAEGYVPRELRHGGGFAQKESGS